MKRLVCEMCGGTDLIKDGGVFICQTCGCKYSVEEAKKMMVEGTVDIQGTVKIDNTAQIQTFLDLSQNAYNARNGQSAFDYANKALEIAPQNADAWISKMKSIEYMSTFGDSKLMEVIEAGNNAVTYAPEDRKEEILLEVYGYELNRAIEMLKLATNKINDFADITNAYKTFCGINFLTATENAIKADSKTVSMYDNIANEALSMVMLVPDEVLANYTALAKMAVDCANLYQYEIDALSRRLSIYGSELTASTKSSKNENKRKVEAKAVNAKRLAEEKEVKEKSEKREAYWIAHAEEKVSLETEKADLESKLVQLSIEIQEIENEEALLPSKKMYDDINSRISSKKSELDSLGFFKGKEKKALQTEIEQLRIDKSAAWDAFQEESKSIKERINALYVEKKKISTRINEIKREFTIDR